MHDTGQDPRRSRSTSTIRQIGSIAYIVNKKGALEILLTVGIVCIAPDTPTRREEKVRVGFVED
jgi:hypothetical protein